ncbi:unnamed protein product [Lactuca saligna]|uniref:SWIM-type domain-containing protein n=1 Tax=Lactuca saligna TaxID=75948 RepID=A0AA35VI01_LACSI|nr:unnamed protein product [Lactuca saligna]
MSDCFDYSSDDTEDDDDQYDEEAINCNEYDDDDFYNSDDQYSRRNQLSDYASEEESFNSNVVDSPGGKTMLWKPIVPKDFMSDVDAIYQSLEEAVEMYKLYADKVGFGVRLNTVTRFGDKTIKKSGRNKRNSNFKITDCKALIKFERLHMQTNACKIYECEENHNHPLETKEERQYSKCARRLSHKDKEFIVRSSTSNIGATKAHKLQDSLQGGYENVVPDAIDYKNFRRKMGNIICDKDAQLVVDKMNMRKDELHNYTFEYKCVDSVLNAMFWADETDNLYYKEFGDVSADFLKNTDFQKRFTKLVWNVHIEPKVFESRWKLLMRKFKLQDKRWFKDMYRDRKLWIPGYFKDMPLHGLMKTTSRTESVNSFFNKYSNYGNLLIYFMMNYDTAIGKQRNAQQKLEHDTKNAKHEMTLPSGLLEHAAAVYTKKNFYEVELKLPEKEVKCSCNHFIHTGILCRHIFVVLRNNQVEEIPEQYILRRWRRDVISSHLLAMKYVAMETEDDTFKLLTKAYINIAYCLDHFKRSNKKFLEFVEKTRTLKQAPMEFGSSNQTSPDNDEEEIIRMLGIRSIPDEINIHPPASIRTKGSGTKKRMVSAIEKAVAAAKKKTRMCTGYNQYVNHNWRTCKVRLARESKVD